MKMNFFQEEGKAKETGLLPSNESIEPVNEDRPEDKADEPAAASPGWTEDTAEETPNGTQGWTAELEISSAEAKKHLQTVGNLQGKPVISHDDGRVVGTIKEIYLDPHLERITAIRIGGDGLFDFSLNNLFNPKFQLVQSEQVALFGFVLVLIINAEAIVESEQTPELEQWLKLSDLKGREVKTFGGTHIGTVSDVIFQPGHGHEIIGFTLASVAVEGPLAKARAIAREVVVEPGSQHNPMTIDLSRAEQQHLSVTMIE